MATDAASISRLALRDGAQSTPRVYLSTSPAERGQRRLALAAVLLSALIFAALAPKQYSNGLSATPEGILTTACAQMRISSGTGRQPQYALVFAGEHQANIKKAGWSREDVQRYCFENSKSTVAELKRINITAGDIKPEDERALYPLVERSQDFLVIAAGGNAGVQSAIIHGWGSKSGSQSVTKEIKGKR